MAAAGPGQGLPPDNAPNARGTSTTTRHNQNMSLAALAAGVGAMSALVTAARRLREPKVRRWTVTAGAMLISVGTCYALYKCGARRKVRKTRKEKSQERYLKRKEIARVKRKERVHRRGEEVRALPPDELDALRWKHHLEKVERHARLEKVLTIDAEMSPQVPTPLSPHLRIAVDLRYGEGVSGERGLRSLGKQLTYAWTAVRSRPNVESTPSVHLTSYTGRVREVLGAQGVGSWQIHRHAEALEQMFPLESMVYLSPDAEDVMEVLDLTRVYVIGGIVDRQVIKSISLDLATSLGMKAVRLPTHLMDDRQRRTIVLNIDTVIKILLEMHDTGDWVKALQCAVPPRKQVDPGPRPGRMDAEWKRPFRSKSSDSVSQEAPDTP